MYRAIASRSSTARVTKLLGNPFAQPPLNFFLWNRALRISCFQTVANLLDYIKVILNVFERTVVRQLIQESLNFLFSSTHILNLPQNYALSTETTAFSQ